ncbi:MAG TPA: HEPN domain-containing protein [Agriterribacter sp.]|nr:hypothetical protein [Chitinophagaceae bacterium]HRP33800.1 HEPN domain-containing protein [Agriterribacter sp.]
MANSLLYIGFKQRLLDLESHLLPAISPTLTYTAKDEDLTRAYCLLCHAEIEAYIESIVLATATQAYNKWSTDKTKVSQIIFHLAYSYKQVANKPKEPPYSMVSLTFSQLQKSITSNNGIKEDNLNLILKPIGFEIDPPLALLLTNFGKTRGTIAHTSISTQQPLDPATEKNNVTQILTALKSFDEDLVDYEANGIINTTPVNMAWDSLTFWQRLKYLFTG